MIDCNHEEISKYPSGSDHYAFCHHCDADFTEMEIQCRERIKELESAWQDAEMRADTNLKRVEELERELRLYRTASTCPRGYQ